MVTCDVFDLHITVNDRMLGWNLSTDLPGGTRVMVDVFRRFTNTRGDPCVWSLWSDAILLTPTGPGDRNGASGNLNIDSGDAHGLSRFNALLGPYSSGILKPVDAEVHVQVTVGARQPMKAFGKNNCNLTGGMVVESGGINIVREEVVVVVEMRPEYQPIQFEASAPSGASPVGNKAGCGLSFSVAAMALLAGLGGVILGGAAFPLFEASALPKGAAWVCPLVLLAGVASSLGVFIGFAALAQLKATESSRKAWIAVALGGVVLAALVAFMIFLYLRPDLMT